MKKHPNANGGKGDCASHGFTHNWNDTGDFKGLKWSIWTNPNK